MSYQDYSKSSEMLGRMPAVTPKRRKLGVLGLFIVIFAITVVAGFCFAVYQEIQLRQAKLGLLLKEVRPATENSILDNKLIGELAGGAASSSEDSASSSSDAGAKSDLRQKIERTDRPHLGSLSAGLVIVEFGDFECPVCKQAFPAIRTITNKYPNDILFIFRNYPVIDDNSSLLAQAALCAGEQNRYWQLHDRLFMNQDKIASLDGLKALASKAGVNWTALLTCIDSEKYRTQVMTDMSDGLDAGVAGTPTFFINGTKLEGAVPLANWEDIIKKYKDIYKK